MDLERSILNKTNSSFKHILAPDNYTQLSTASSVDEAVLSHFRVIDASPMQSLPEARESNIEAVDRHGVNYQPRDDEYHHHHHHHNDKLMAMAEVVSDACYSQQATYCPPPPAAVTHHQDQQNHHHYQHHESHQGHTSAVTSRSYHHHLPTPATSPEDYNSPDVIPPAPDVPTPAATPAEVPAAEDVVYDGDVTEIQSEQENRDHDEQEISTTTNNNNASRAFILADNRLAGNRQAPVENENGPFIPVCQYQYEGRCEHESAHCRKTVSHVFGRNKTCTQLIPGHLWIWYCRKHYQRRRYQVPNWAQQQVHIVRETLNKFQAWGKIQCFSVTLRKREQDRNRNNPTASRSSTNVPESRRRATGRITASRAQTILRKARATATAATAAAAAAAGRGRGRDPSQEAAEVTSTGRRKSYPVNVASPVPDFLYAYLGENKSFAQVREIIDAIETYIQFEEEVNDKEVTFPDIEILPVFTLEFLQDSGRTTDQLSDNNHSRRRRAARNNVRPPRDVQARLRDIHRSAAITASASARLLQQHGREIIPYQPASVAAAVASASSSASPSTSVLPPIHGLPFPLPPARMHSHHHHHHGALSAHNTAGTNYDAQTHGHAHLPPLAAPPVHMHMAFGEFQ